MERRRKYVQLPNVFVGSAYGKPFRYTKFRETLDKLPFRFIYANDVLEPIQLMESIRKIIRKVDYCVFDISTWNPNVALEIGLAEALGAKYYILLNSQQAKEVPSDIKGLQRINYSNYRYPDPEGLLNQLIRNIVVKDPILRRIWDKLGHTTNRDKRFYFALRTLAHLRDHRVLTERQADGLSVGTRLNADSRADTLRILKKMKLIRSGRHGMRLQRRLFKAWKV